MDKILSLLKSKKFWALVAAIVAALTAFFTTSCSAQAKVQRHGIHIDTVRVDYIIRSRNITTASCDKHLLPNEFSSSSSGSLILAIPMRFVEEKFSFSSIRHQLDNSNHFLSGLPRQSTAFAESFSLSDYPLLSLTSRLLVNPLSVFVSSSSISGRSSMSCLAAMLIAFPLSSASFIQRSRRGGKRGGKRPKGTKSIPLGGQHL